MHGESPFEDSLVTSQTWAVRSGAPVVLQGWLCHPGEDVGLVASMPAPIHSEFSPLIVLV